jgi:PhnB protein
MTVKKIPDGYHSIAPYLVVANAAEAIEFYSKAFGAHEHMRLTMPDGRVGHAEIRIGNSIVMLGSAFPEMGFHAPDHYGGSPASIFLYVEDMEAVFTQAIKDGATEKQPPTDMFWGDRMAKVDDPFGYQWSIATHFEDVAPEEVRKRLEKAYAS